MWLGYKLTVCDFAIVSNVPMPGGVPEAADADMLTVAEVADLLKQLPEMANRLVAHTESNHAQYKLSALDMVFCKLRTRDDVKAEWEGGGDILINSCTTFVFVFRFFWTVSHQLWWSHRDAT